MPLLGIYAGSVQKASGAFESIATATGTGSSGTITFSNIPGTYQHLQIRYLNTTSSSGESVLMQFNSDTGSNYTRHWIRGQGSTASASGTASTTSIYVGSTNSGTDTTYPEVSIIDIHDYASTSKNKTARAFTGIDKNGSGDVQLLSGLWQSTSAITSIKLFITANFTTNSVFALYGIKGA